MARVTGKIMRKDAFLHNSPYTKETYEGILVSADPENEKYDIGIQLGENEVLLVDQVDNENKIRTSFQKWVPQISTIQQQYGVHNDPANY